MHYLFKNGFQQAYDAIQAGDAGFGMHIGMKSHDFMAHIVDDDIVIVTSGQKVLTLRPDLTATIHFSAWSNIDQNFRNIIERSLGHKGVIYMTSKMAKAGRTYTIKFLEKDTRKEIASAKTNYEIDIENYENTQCAISSRDLEVVEDKSRRSEWFAHIKEVRRTAKVAIRVNPFQTSQYNILAKQSGQNWFHSTNVPLDVQMDWVNNKDIASITQYAVACEECWSHRRDNKPMTWQDQVKAVEKFFVKMTRQFHKSNIELKAAA